MLGSFVVFPGDTGALSLRMFTEIAEIFLTHEMFEAGQHQTQIKKLHRIVLESLLPKYVEILCLLVLLCLIKYRKTSNRTPWILLEQVTSDPGLY